MGLGIQGGRYQHKAGQVCVQQEYTGGPPIKRGLVWMSIHNCGLVINGYWLLKFDEQVDQYLRAKKGLRLSALYTYHHGHVQLSSRLQNVFI